MEKMVGERFTIYKNKKVLVTGHTGFKGSWLLYWLRMLGADVMGYSLPAEDNTLFNAIDGKSLCESIEGDIRNYGDLSEKVNTFQPDYIFHLAAQSLVRPSYLSPVATWDTNVMGTANLLESIRSLKKHCVVVVITTDKVYENKEWIYPYRETDALGGYDPYSASKAASDLLISSYRSSFFNVSDFSKHNKIIITARAGNVIGGGDWAVDRIVPDLIRSLIANRNIELRNPNAIRPWQHVVEPLYGYLELCARANENISIFSSAWNFGPSSDDILTVESLAKAALLHWQNSGSKLLHQPRSDMHEAGTLLLDISKARHFLNWKPSWDAARSVEKTILWYKKFHEGESAKALIENDISNYFSLYES
jgi:CDP-glucose 4,6-dehydratase